MRSGREADERQGPNRVRCGVPGVEGVVEKLAFAARYQRSQADVGPGRHGGKVADDDEGAGSELN